jgi:hypothetical protein
MEPKVLCMALLIASIGLIAWRFGSAVPARRPSA